MEVARCHINRRIELLESKHRIASTLEVSPWATSFPLFEDSRVSYVRLTSILLSLDFSLSHCRESVLASAA